MKDNSENCHRGGGKGGKGQGSGNGGKGGSRDTYHVESYKEVYPFSPEQYTEE